MKCSQSNCSFETDSDIGFKAHMSKSHGGYTVEDLKAQGIVPNQRDIARSLAGNASARDVTEQAPAEEPKPGESVPGPKRTRRKANETDPEVEKAKQDILRARCRRIASLPYTLLSSLFSDPELKLHYDEEQMLTEAYLTLAMAYGWEGTSKLLLWGDVLICNAAVISARRESLLHDLGLDQPKPPAEEKEPEKTETVQ